MPRRPSRPRRAVCQKQASYPTPVEAAAALRAIRDSATRTPIYPIRYVWCAEHGAYHLTSRPGAGGNLADGQA